MRNLSFIINCLMVFIVGTLISSCSVQQSAINNSGIDGAYTLISVDGKSVPASLSHGALGIEIRSGIFTINADGTCNSMIIMVPASGSELEREVSATYTLDGSTLSMQWKGAGRTEGIIEGDTFTMVNEGIPYVYRK